MTLILGWIAMIAVTALFVYIGIKAKKNEKSNCIDDDNDFMSNIDLDPTYSSMSSNIFHKDPE